MTLGDLLAQVAEFIWELWPIRVVPEWERGFRVTFGRIGRELGPGAHAFWPLIGSIETETVTLDVDVTDAQVATTKDGQQVMFALAYKRRVVDPRRLWRAIQDHDSTVANEICAAAAEAVPDMLERDLNAELAEAVRVATKRRLTGWGTELLDVSIFSLARVRTYRLVTGE